MQSLWPFRKEPTQGLRKMGGPSGTSRISVFRGKGPPRARTSLSSSGWMKWKCSEEAVTSSTSTSRVEGMLTMVLRTVEEKSQLSGMATPTSAVLSTPSREIWADLSRSCLFSPASIFLLYRIPWPLLSPTSFFFKLF